MKEGQGRRERQENWKNLFTGVVTLILLFFLIRSFWKQNPEQPAPLPSPTPLPTVSVPKPLPPKAVKKAITKGAAQNTAPYPFHQIERRVKADRFQLAGCLLKNTKLKTSRFDLVLHWSGSAELMQVQLTPDPGQEVIWCVEELVQGWNLPAHPGLQPFSFKTRLIPSI